MAAITLAEAKNNTQDDLDLSVIDEFRKGSAVNDTMIFDQAVSPAAGGATLTYGYRRLVTQATAATRALNTEYTDQNVTTERYTVDLAVLGGSFSVDRVIASLGAAASGSISLNMGQKIKATNAEFADLVINGDVATDANAFDGLDKALTGSSTEMQAGTAGDWTDFDTNARAEYKALDLIDEWLSLLDGTPTIILGNKLALARVRAAARRASMYTKDPVADLVGQNGRPIERETYGGIIFADAGIKAGTNDPIVPVATDGTTSLYAYRVGLDGFHAVATNGGQIVRQWLPDFSTSGAVKRGEVEMGPVAVALKATKAATVLRGLKVKAGA